MQSKSSDRSHPRYNEIFLKDFPEPYRMAENFFVGYPSSYRAGMSNLGFHFLFGKLRMRQSMRVERFFTDSVPATIETGSRLSRAKALFFSVSYEEDYLNLARMLVESGIEPARSQRGCRPLIIAGGPAPSANPLPLGEIADIIALGEGEATIESLADFAIGYSEGGEEEITRSLSGIDGLYLPHLPARKASFGGSGGVETFPMSVIVSSGTVFSDMVLIEIGRGCPSNCAFCLASALYRPHRTVPFESFSRQVESIPQTVSRVGLVSTSVTAHPDFERIVQFLKGRGITPSFSSLRAEDIDEEKAGLIAEAGTRSVSLAPESGSEEGRRSLGKRVANESYIEAAGLLSRSGIRNFNLYMLCGYPAENEDVMRETGVFLERFSRAAGNSAVSVHVNFLIPKALTPFQFYGMPESEKLRRIASRLEMICRKENIRVRSKSIRGAFRQAVLSLGGADVGRAVVAYSKGKVSWKKALKDCGVDPEFIHRQRGVDKPLPWEDISGRVKRENILSRYLAMVKGKR